MAHGRNVDSLTGARRRRVDATQTRDGRKMPASWTRFLISYFLAVLFNAILRFVCRRETPRVIHSDNGANFKGH